MRNWLLDRNKILPAPELASEFLEAFGIPLTSELLIQLRVRLPWSDEEIQSLKALIDRRDGKIVEEFRRKYPFRSLSAIRKKWERLGMKSARFWSRDEEAYLRECFEQSQSFRECADLFHSRFPDRTDEEIYRKLKRMGLVRSKFWSKEEEGYLKELLSMGFTRQDAAKAFRKRYPSRTFDSIFDKWKILKLQGMTPFVEENSEDGIEELLEKIERHRKASLRFVERKEVIRIGFGGEPIGLVFLGDWHIGSLGTNHSLILSDAKLISRTKNVFCCLLGDYVELYKVFPGKFETETVDFLTPQEQYLLLKHIFEILGRKILAVVLGTHDSWLQRKTGIDFIGNLVKEVKANYLGYGGLLVIGVGSQTYRICLRHEFPGKSQYSPTFAIGKMLRDYQDFDVGVLGHIHEPSLQEITLRGKRRYFLRLGSYKVEWDPYMEKLGFRLVRNAWMPMVVLFPDKWRIHAFKNFKEGIEFLEFVKKKYQN